MLSEIAITDLPLYSQDHDADYPPVARAFRRSIADVDAVLFVTPEFGGLKNAIDWAIRPWGKNSFAQKPSGVIGASPGAIGTAVAHHRRGRGQRRRHEEVPAELHGRAACLHRARADRAAPQGLSAGLPRTSP